MPAWLSLRSPLVLGVLGTSAFFASWEALSHSGLVNAIMLPPPSRIVQSGIEVAATGELRAHVEASVFRSIIGFLIGSSLGITIGIAMARSPMFYGLFNPLLQMFRAIPALAFVPLAIFWLGIGEVSKIFLISWGVFFPVFMNSYLGARDIDPLIYRAATSLGARGWRVLIFVIIPAALPFVIAGLRIGVSAALVLLVAAELAGATFGVGYLIQTSQQVFRVDLMFVGLILLGVLGLTADFAFRGLIEHLFPWYGADQLQSRGATDVAHGQASRT